MGGNEPRGHPGRSSKRRHRPAGTTARLGDGVGPTTWGTSGKQRSSDGGRSGARKRVVHLPGPGPLVIRVPGQLEQGWDERQRSRDEAHVLPFQLAAEGRV